MEVGRKIEVDLKNGDISKSHRPPSKVKANGEGALFVLFRIFYRKFVSIFKSYGDLPASILGAYGPVLEGKEPAAERRKE